MAVAKLFRISSEELCCRREEEILPRRSEGRGLVAGSLCNEMKSIFSIFSKHKHINDSKIQLGRFKGFNVSYKSSRIHYINTNL